MQSYNYIKRDKENHNARLSSLSSFYRKNNFRDGILQTCSSRKQCNKYFNSCLDWKRFSLSVEKCS